MAVLAVAAVLVLTAGLLVRRALEHEDAPSVAAPPSEAAAMQQLSQEGALRRMSELVARRVADVAPLVTYVPDADAAGVRWRDDVIVTTLPRQPVVARPRPSTDSLRAAPRLAADSGTAGWVLAVARRGDGRVISTAGLVGGRVPTRCGDREVEELVLGVPLHEALAGAGLFSLDGELLGLVVRCPGRVAALPVDEVARQLVDSVSIAPRVRDAFGLAATLLDAPARAYFGADSGLLVTETVVGGAAAAAGLRPGDVLLAIDGTSLRRPEDLRLLEAHADTSGALVTRRRGGATAAVRLVRRPAGPADPALADVGIALAPATPARGIAVGAVAGGSAADAAGLRAGDRLLRVGDVAVRTPVEVRRLLTAVGSPGAAPRFVVFERDSVERGVLLVPR